MKRIRFETVVILLAMTFVLAAPADAKRLTVWGPETFSRTTGAPVTVTRTSTIAAFDPARDYYIRIYNGPAPRTRVTSATVTMNGVTVFGPSDFNSQVERLQKLIPLTSANTVLTVRIAGAPGSGFAVRVVRGLRDDGDNNNDEDDDTGVPIPPPTITAAIAPPPNEAGWNNGPVTVTFNCAAPESSVSSCTAPVTVSTEGANQNVTGTVVNAEGQTAFFNVKLNVDRTPPGVSPVLSPAPNAAGWNNTDVSAAFFCADALSGVASCSPPSLLTVEGANQAVGGTAMDVAGNFATATTAVSIDKTPPLVTPTAAPPPNAAGWNNQEVTATFSCSDLLSGVASCAPSVTLSADGANQVTTGEATDVAGNVGTASLTVNIDKTPPTINAFASPPPNVHGWNNSEVSVLTECVDALSGLSAEACPQPVVIATEGSSQTVQVSVSDTAGNTSTASLSVNLDFTPPTLTPTLSPLPNASGWNNSDVTVTFAGIDALSGIDPAAVTTPEIVTTEGPGQVVTGVSIDRAGNVATGFATVSLDKTAPTLTITEPTAATPIRRLPNLPVKGTATDDNLVNVVLNGTDLGFTQSFDEVLPLVEGGNSFTVIANDLAGNTTARTVAATFVRPPMVRITSPTDLAAVGTSPITFTGTVSDPAATVKVGVLQIPATVSGGNWTASVPLAEGGNVVTAVATDANGNAGTDSMTITLDTESPRVIIDSPAAGSLVTTPTITVTGRVNDSVLGTINSAQASVTVNGVPATMSNRTFRVAGITLQPGLNSLVASALDATGNQDSKTVMITYDNLPGARLEALGGDLAGTINEPLPSPLAVRVTDPAGAPLPNRDVIFRVASNSGSVLPAAEGVLATPKRAIIVKTDSAGEARALLTLGSRAGEGNNRVEVSSPGVAGGHTFLISGQPKVPALISVDEGGLQRGVPGQPLPRPFVVVVTDEGHNRLVGVPVKFKVEAGGGDFDGVTEKTATTDADGRALVILTLGPVAGIESNVVTATVDQLVGLPAAFTATALEPGDAADTRITGVVLDNENDPIAGVTLRIRNTATATQTDAQGQFTLGGVPVGDVHLQVDGSTAQRPGTYPNLEFQLQTVSGAENTVGMPIYLLPLDLNQSIFVDETHGGTIAMAAFPGFKLDVAPNSAIFPDGSRRGTVSVTVVHADKVPMVPNVGQQPRLIVTIQPPGVRFDPPASMSLPNVEGLPAGEVVELYSFDHDAGRFVTTGTAATSEDGSTLTSEAGTGVLKGGWFSFGSPLPAATVAKCPECQKCDGVGCPPDPAKEKKPCGTDPTCLWCRNGVCEKRKLGLIMEPVGNPSPSDATWPTNFSFLGKTTHVDDATDAIDATVALDPALDPADINEVVWQVNTFRGSITDFVPDPRKGPTVQFRVEPYLPTDPEMVYTRNNGRLGRSQPLLLRLNAQLCSVSTTSQIVQDERDILRQEYANHELWDMMPARSDFCPRRDSPSGKFSAAELNQTAYPLQVGDPGALADAVRNEFNLNIQALLGLPARPDYGLAVSSGWRNPERNEAVGGVRRSAHQRGAAIDFALPAVPGLTDAELWQALEDAGAQAGASLSQCEERNNPGPRVDCRNPRVNHVHVQINGAQACRP